MVDARELALAALEDARQQRLIETANRNDNPPPPISQYVGFDCRTGEALLRPVGGGIVRGQPIYNTAVRSGDVMDLHVSQGLPKADSLSAWEPEPEPVVEEERKIPGKLIILFSTPDGGLWIGGDRKIPKRIGSWSDDENSSYTIAKTGDRENNWVVIKTEYLGGQNVRFTWIPSGRQVTITDNSQPTDQYFEEGRIDGFTPSITFHNNLGGGLIYVEANIHHFGTNIARPVDGTLPLYNLVDLEITESGSRTMQRQFDPAQQGTSSDSYTGSQEFNSLLLGPALTRKNEGQGNHELSSATTAITPDITSTSETDLIDYQQPFNVAINITRTAQNRYHNTTSYQFEFGEINIPVPGTYQNTTDTNFVRITPLSMGHKGGGYWREEINYLEPTVTTSGPIPSPEHSTTHYLNGQEVDHAKAPAGIWTLFNGQLYGAQITSPTTATINIGFSGQSKEISYFPIPEGGTRLSHSYHP